MNPWWLLLIVPVSMILGWMLGNWIEYWLFWADMN